MHTEREDNETYRAIAKNCLDEVKRKLLKRRGEFVTRRIDSRTIIMARPERIDDIINQLKRD